MCLRNIYFCMMRGDAVAGLLQAGDLLLLGKWRPHGHPQLSSQGCPVPSLKVHFARWQPSSEWLKVSLLVPTPCSSLGEIRCQRDGCPAGLHTAPPLTPQSGCPPFPQGGFRAHFLKRKNKQTNRNPGLPRICLLKNNWCNTLKWVFKRNHGWVFKHP